MNDSHIYKALGDVQSALAAKGIAKSQTNTFDKYKFRGIDDVLNTLAPILADCGVIVVPDVKKHECTQVTTAKGGVMNHSTVWVDYRMTSTVDGSFVGTTFIGEAMDRGDKSINKALTAAFKYFLFEIFCIPVQGTEDADESSHEVTHSYISENQVKTIRLLLEATDTDETQYAQYRKVDSIEMIPAAEFTNVVRQLQRKRDKMAQEYAKQEAATAAAVDAQEGAAEDLG